MKANTHSLIIDQSAPFADELSLELSLLTNSFEKTFHKKGEVLFREDHPAWCMYYIETGKVKLFKYGTDGKEQIIKLAHAGEFLAYASLLHHTKYNVSATIIEDATLIVIPKEDFMDMFSQSSLIASYFTQLLCQDIIDTEKRLTDMAYRPVRGRLAEVLLSLDKIFHQENEEEEDFISLSRQDLASLLGTAKETVIRILSEFKGAMLITTDGPKISILNPQGLLHISLFYN
ncbi:CRP-like cAMP-binding protein [Catalinimonas alkaloidigena]|uniref:Crp/Fnr family transcriptional regulator n=1 Tax=Catalinimonas alkaloidigena TaxID=1075417 RepID=UPI0024060205|nr:Crp/Fnr family transcriptional regulator [Catalinimonas alkaloidigena]MDF9797853.1 CRP-like cAMP-binding protein [Catalinimonas alkaloidigena]